MDIMIFPAVVGRARPDGDLIEARLNVTLADDSWPEFEGGHVEIMTFLPVASGGQLPLSHLERLADAQIAALLEAISADLRKRAAG